MCHRLLGSLANLALVYVCSVGSVQANKFQILSIHQTLHANMQLCPSIPIPKHRFLIVKEYFENLY